MNDTANDATGQPLRDVVTSTLKSVQGTLNHLPLLTLDVLTEKLIEALAPLLAAELGAILREVADRLKQKADALTEDMHDLAMFVAKARIAEAEILDREAAELRRLAEIEPGAQAEPPDVLAEAVAALQSKAGELSDLADEEMRRDLEEQAQVWHEAAGMVQKLKRSKLEVNRG